MTCRLASRIASRVLLVLFCFAVRGISFAACQQDSIDGKEKFRPSWEVAMSNMVIYSQEYMRYFFADDSSEVRPLPASGLSLFLAKDVSKKLRFINAFTLPLREEEVTRRSGNTYKYYYPKLVISGLESDFLEHSVGKSQSCLHLSSLFGIALPLGERFLKYFPPILMVRTGIEVGKDTFLNFGIGYSGNIKNGAWFFPFGVTYRIEDI